MIVTFENTWEFSGAAAAERLQKREIVGGDSAYEVA
jgi:hypothetical protein